jgi:hypothetical protein
VALPITCGRSSRSGQSRSSSWLGICLQALLADVTGRSYAETPIKRTVDCLVASAADPVLADTEQAALRVAHGVGSVVIDTSALVLLDHLGEHARRLTSVEHQIPQNAVKSCGQGAVK